MKIEDQICSFDQGTRLKDLGIANESFFMWCNPNQKFKDGSEMTMYIDMNIESRLLDLTNKGYIISPAFTTAELGIMLPKGYCSGNGVLSNSIKWCDKVSYTGDDVTFLNDNVVTSGPTEAIARASMLITLLESGELTAEEVNASLI